MPAGGIIRYLPPAIIFLGLLIVIAFASPSYAQSGQPVRQSGVVTSSHTACWTYEGIIQDCSTIPNQLSLQLDQSFGNTPGDILCRGTTAWVALSPGANGQYLQTQSTSGCPHWVTPGSIFSNPIRTISSGTADTAATSDGTIAWNSSSASPKDQTIYACAPGVNGNILNIKDEAATAGTYAITITPVSGTIEKAASLQLMFNSGAITIQCDGSVGNWIAL